MCTPFALVVVFARLQAKRDALKRAPTFSVPAASYGSRCDDAFGFDDGVYAVEGGNGDLLFQAAGPVNFDLVHFGGGAEAEMETLVGTRRVTAAAENVGALANRTCGDKNLCANRVARTLRPANEFEGHPVIRILDDVAQ